MLRSAFAQRFGRAEPDGVEIVRAPGRVNLIGEHTDYNQGLVLPVAIDLEIRIARRLRDDHRVRIALAATGELAELDLERIGPPTGGWIDYVGGDGAQDGDRRAPDLRFDGVLASTIPQAAGLSSSAALELAAAGRCPDLAGRTDPLTLARIAQRAENTYVGVMCGLMDQFASANGVAGAAVLLDCRSLDHRAVPLPPDLVLVVAHTGVPRTLGTSGVQRPAGRLRARGGGARRGGAGCPVTRDVDGAMLARHGHRLDLMPIGPRLVAPRPASEWRTRSDDAVMIA